MVFEDKIISVIVPFYRAEKHIPTIVFSLINQERLPDEVIFIDDGEGVGFDLLIDAISYSVLSSRSIFVSCINNSGPAFARNLGLSLAKGRYIAFLDCDDYWTPSFLKDMEMFAISNKASLVACSAIFKVQGRERTLLRLPSLLAFYDVLQTCPILVPAVLIDRFNVGYFEFPAVSHEDHALWLALLKDGWIFTCLDKPLVVINRVPGSVSSDKFRAAIWQWGNLKSSGVGAGARFVCFFVYSVNALLKRFLRIYSPVILPPQFFRFLLSR